MAISTEERIIFRFRDELSFWLLDDVSVIDTTNGLEMISDGSFENLSTTAWNQCSYGNISSVNIITGTPRSGSYSYMGGSPSSFNYISQTMDMIIGRMYNISFWLMNNGSLINGAIVSININSSNKD